jgi:hypothetical protein
MPPQALYDDCEVIPGPSDFQVVGPEGRLEDLQGALLMFARGLQIPELLEQQAEVTQRPRDLGMVAPVDRLEEPHGALLIVA